ncbi:PaaI family thioesterase [Erythrobacter aureus]|uniref:PaaI family thioesterase n=1 Tax=Erythrobacter aureus TaxID=2182384 RepID=A0A345YBK4_9SPHN|nr:PaaI family thioesterase [Erythrobacter aureus]AXK41306.1 PaaI family thioesterase [Erythrobacter aureus]
MTESPIPQGFARHDRKSPVTDPWEPLYSKTSETGVTLGLVVAKSHCNSRGFAHGGVIATLADNCLGLSCAARDAEISGLVTINLDVNYVGSAKIGQWLEFACTFAKVGRSTVIAQGIAEADDERCANFSAVFQAYRKES